MTRAQGAPKADTPTSVEAFAREHGLELVRIAYLLCGDRQRAEDLAQDVLLNLHRRFPGPITLDNPLAYARRALVNTNISRSPALQCRNPTRVASRSGLDVA
jgi:DNA-directed RNA polymerase specialized sigma24 family protein